jgi:hypothetical protein
MMRYEEPNAISGDSRWEKYIEAIKTGGKVIEAKYALPVPTKGPRRRLGYIGLFEISDVRVAGNPDCPGRSRLTFRFTKRLESFR